MAVVVVVDDEPLVRDLYGVWLESAGHQIVALESAAAGQVALAVNGADVLLTDIRMTTADEGIGLLSWARQHDPTLSVVLITGVPEVSTAVEALRLAAYDYLVKPVPRELLLRVIARAAERAALQRERARLEEENRRYQSHLQALVEERTRALERRTGQLLLLNAVVSEINALQDNTQAVIAQAVAALRTDLGYHHAEIHEVSRASGTTRAIDFRVADERLPVEGVALVLRAADHGPAGRIFPASSQLSEDDAPAYFPISVGGMIRHVLMVPDREGAGLDAADTTVLSTLTEHLGIALANADLYARLRGALQVREQILQNVSHELRTPLTLISGYAELLAEDKTLPHSAAEMLEIIMEQTDHLGRLVNQLLTFQSVDTESIEKELMVINHWLESQAEMWRPILERAGLRLHLACPEPPIVVNASWDYLSEVLQNLLDNARKFSPEGGAVSIEARLQQDEVVVSVSDQGIGVSSDKLPNLFERFYQADGGVTRRFGGMGLGLALVREIIANHGGRVWAESPGEGAGFTVSFALPVAA